MKCAFTMIELIFVIVLMGIMASIGGNLLPDNRLLNGTNTVTMKIKEKQKDAIGNDVTGFGIPWTRDSNATCITLDDNLTKEDVKDKAIIHVVPVGFSNPLCFDQYGRPYLPIEEHLLLNKVGINVTYKQQDTTISVFPMSGYVIINNYNEI
jgi:prepilin-type N-terminal cleavage/methylation domain-containing protein